jgi:tRNA threonylcarbamoyladenosine biosynthesis protein TsaB
VAGNNFILCLETATEVCSVALSESGRPIAEKSIREANAHGSILTVLIEEILKEARLKFSDLSAVAYSDGPGSYTGLRIGLSVAKGICYGSNVPLIAVSTLQHMSYGLDTTSVLHFPMLDARRMEVYGALLDTDHRFLIDPFACIVDAYNWEELLKDREVCFFGNGMAKSKELLSAFTNASFDDDYLISANTICPVAEEKLNAHQFTNLAYHVPFYLKEANVTVAKKKML